ncbi:sigma-70 family RNA polymerase sigma factor [Vibrio sp. V27_P1S3P104]|uniref:ECF-type sigma factor n=1 Tax=Vibrio TaxID=662 RepID=UPI000C16CC93|nr:MULTISPECIES: ECF-type sigma factor [Vibrio]NAW69249.1 sigma-70 family RNA polymerase sigma factor [Vibrio sp. V28_P6S34P95]NAX06114.1 sigma-70 family RNA polymerase sigma factor [Vibrio sp. V30_P3S12P165]NAX35714.1 sigma-70 family RNA polymerase sigma factor [Vibrio sp. V29_P1S30P107]NAX35962.1 sigma-70 family RNA polymerase sigma factor [Vibrio sp. V27_P1S3P104]NAX41457.1 sigma-70 family RNA polymerase sigma factor [Vibrio sp. V26_P1S5P106]
MNSFTHILCRWQQGDKEAEAQLYQLAYQQLRQIAAQERRKNIAKYGDHAIQEDHLHNTTALVHDAYIKLAQANLQDIQHQREFLLLAAKVMQQILIDHARAAQAKKRQATMSYSVPHPLHFEQLVLLDKTLDHFTIRYPRQSNALKLKYFIGMKTLEISQLLECSASLIEKDLKFAHSWLQMRMSDQ